MYPDGADELDRDGEQYMAAKNKFSSLPHEAVTLGQLYVDALPACAPVALTLKSDHGDILKPTYVIFPELFSVSPSVEPSLPVAVFEKITASLDVPTPIVGVTPNSFVHPLGVLTEFVPPVSRTLTKSKSKSPDVMPDGKVTVGDELDDTKSADVVTIAAGDKDAAPETRAIPGIIPGKMPRRGVFNKPLGATKPDERCS